MPKGKINSQPRIPKQTARENRFDFSGFQGFDNPTTTPTPDLLFDHIMQELNQAELKVLLYIIRRTFGFKKKFDDISLNQLVDGIRTKEGKVLDRGTGLSKSAVARALRALKEKHLIEATQNMDPEKGYLPTTYSLNIITPPSPAGGTRVVSLMTQGMSHQRDIQQTVLQQTDVVVINALKKFKIGEEKAEEIAAKYSPEHIAEKIEFLEWKIETKARGRPIADPASWLIRAIEKDYKPPETFKPKAQREKEAEEKARQEEERERAYQAQEEERERERAQLLEDFQRTYGTTSDDEKVWAQVLEEIQLATTKATYQTWFPQTTLLSLKDGQAVIGVPNQATREWLSGRLATIVQRALESVIDHPVKPTFEVLGPPQNVLEH